MIKPSITIFGVGRVGGALKKSLSNAGYSIASTFVRNTIPESKNALGDIIFLTVHDRDIKNLADELASSFPSFEDKYVIHCSGTLDSSVLKSLAEKGAKTASFHPLKAITLDDDSLAGVWFDMEGDASALKILTEIAEDLEAECFEINPEAKPLLHAAAVVAANYLVTLMKLATDIANAGDIDREIALKALLPLTESSLKNIKEKGFKGSLTGPIARGDVETIQRHLQNLTTNPELLKFYKVLGIETLHLVTKLDNNRIKELNNLLKN